MKIQKPTVGRIVNFTRILNTGERRIFAAVITETGKDFVWPDRVDLLVFPPFGGSFPARLVPYSRLGADETWCYPERVVEEIEVDG